MATHSRARLGIPIMRIIMEREKRAISVNKTRDIEKNSFLNCYKFTLIYRDRPETLHTKEGGKDLYNLHNFRSISLSGGSVCR
jgi:hypothetical protein